MKSYLYLTKKYIKSYPKRCIGIVLCISLFLFAFLTILWYSDSFKYTIVESAKIKNGLYEYIGFNVDKFTVSENESTLIDEGNGILKGLWKIYDNQNDIWIGDANENVYKLLPLEFISGEMPKSANEVAIEKSTYDKLNLSSEIGDTVEFTIKNSDGKSEKKSFILTGITKNFSNKLKNLNDETKDILIPSILTVNQDVTPNYIHIFAKEDSYVSRNLNTEYYYFNDSKIEYTSNLKASGLILNSMSLFFVFTTIMGIISVYVYFFKEQEQYLNSLRCIGFSKRKSRRFLFIQSLIIWLSALTIAVIASIIVLWLLQFISSFSSKQMFINLNLVSLISTALLGILVIVISFNILLGRFYRNTPLRKAIYTPRKARKSQTNIKKCWHKAYGRRYRLQNITCIMIIFFCVGMSIFGSFVPLFAARGSTFYDPEGFPNNADYFVHTLGGGSSNEYYIDFPIGSGINHKMADRIISDDRVKVIDASSSELFRVLYLTSKNPENKLLHKYAVELRPPEYNFVFNNSKKDEIIKLAGGNNNGTDQLLCMSILCRSYDSLIDSEFKFVDGKLDEKGYKNGIEVIAPDDLCSIGDEFTMIIPIPDKDATERDINEHIKFEVAKVKVAATYSKEQCDSDRIIISTEYIFSVYPSMNYDNLLLKNLAPDDKNWTEELEQNLDTLNSASLKTKYYNFAEMRREFYDQVNLETLQIIVSVFIFIVIILIAIVFSSYVQVRSNLKSYIMMRAIGARIETVQKLIINEINRTLTTGIILGTILGSAIVAFFSIFGRNIKLWDIYLFYVAPVFVATVILLYFGSRIAVKRAVRSIINQNIIEKLNTVE
ncbi:MAG: ABC transporter permease [Candidatus Pseudoruminococcus sp.]|nr:ABC transporter permease [Ruminococcus sp.]MDY2782426.1 ABC transporter permease [Candidatus Pseudoruminococcus sp.]